MAPLGQDFTASCVPAATQAASLGRDSPPFWALGDSDPDTAGKGSPAKRGHARPLPPEAKAAWGIGASCRGHSGTVAPAGARAGRRLWGLGQAAGPGILPHSTPSMELARASLWAIGSSSATDCRGAGGSSLVLNTAQRNTPETHVVTVPSQQTSWTVRHRGDGHTDMVRTT